MARCIVAIPVYNRQKFIRRCLDSVLAQAADDLEVVVCDNQSTDGTWEYLESVRDRRLRSVRNATNLGMWGNYNRCLELAAAGDYVCLLASDDRLAHGALSAGIAALEADSRAAFYVGRGVLLEEDGRVLRRLGHYYAAGRYAGRRAVLEYLRFYSRYGYPAWTYFGGMLFRGSVLRRVGPFDAALGNVADIDLLLRCLEYGDLTVGDHLTIEVVSHAGQAGKDPGELAREAQGLAEIGRRRLSGHPELEDIRLGFASIAIWQAVHAGLRGQVRTVGRHLSTARQIAGDLVRPAAQLVPYLCRHFGRARRGGPMVYPGVTDCDEARQSSASR